MIVPSCSCCGKQNPIVYSDYEFKDKLQIKLCWDCLSVLGWNTEMGILFPHVKKCGDCKQLYLSKKADSKKCYVCWNNFFNPKINVTEIEEEPHFELKQEELFK